MGIFKHKEDFDDVEIHEFHGKKQNAQNVERAKKIIVAARYISHNIKGASYKISDIDNPYDPNNTTELSLPDYSHIKDRNAAEAMSDLFRLSDYVQIYAPMQIKFRFTVANVWEE